MDPINREKLAANAFRTLGISASVGQSAIQAAARKMRIWPDASRIPPTIWDSPDLGPLRRSKSDIEQAVALLNQPVTRLEHQLLWFLGDAPPTSDNADTHAAALVGLQSAWAETNLDDDGKRWWPVMHQLVQAFGSTDLAARVWAIEEAGQFDKRISPDEMAAALEAVPTAVAAGIVRKAIAALDEERVDVVVEIASAISQVPGSITTGPGRELLDRIEDIFTIRGREMEKDLRTHLRIFRETPHKSYPSNLQHSQRAANFYDQKLLPTLNAIKALAVDDKDRLMRVNSRCGDLLVLLALGWEWSGRFIVAEQHLVHALSIASGTLAERNIRREMERVSVLANRELKYGARSAQKSTIVPRAKRPTSVISRIGRVFIALVMVSGVIGAIFGDHSTSTQTPSNDNSWMTSLPQPRPKMQYTMPNPPQVQFNRPNFPTAIDPALPTPHLNPPRNPIQYQTYHPNWNPAPLPPGPINSRPMGGTYRGR